MKFGVVVFPGTWSDRDCGWVVDQVLGKELFPKKPRYER